jgi:hypothetical protein
MRFLRRADSAGKKGTGDGGRRRGDRGQVAVEYLGLLPVLLFIALLFIQIGLAVYAVQQAGTAARAAARVASMDDPGTDYVTAGRDAVSDWLTPSFQEHVDYVQSVTVTATIPIPSLVPGVGFGSAHRSVTMPLDD